MVGHSDGFEVGAALGLAVGSMVGVGKSEGTIRDDGAAVGLNVYRYCPEKCNGQEEGSYDGSEVDSSDGSE